MIILMIVMVYPYLNQLAISFNEGMDAMSGGITILPRKFTLENYRTVFANKDILNGSIISVSRVILGTFFTLTILFSSAYGITRKSLPFRRELTLFLMIPAYVSAGIIPVYILYRYLHLMNHYLVYILPFGYSFYNMVVLRSFIQGLPESLEESAKMDGANDIVIMYKIIMPLCLPVLATVALWISVGNWNDWTTTLLYITNKKLYPLQFLMMKLIKENTLAREVAEQSSQIGLTRQPTPETIKAATLIVTTIPIIMVYPFLQKYFIQGVTLGAVKE